MRYIGWVPSVLGRLSFTTYRSELTGSSLEGRPSWVFEVEIRDLLDTIAVITPASRAGRFFREHIAQKIFGISGRFAFAFIAKFDEAEDRLVGKVHVVSEALQKNSVTHLKKVSSDDIENFSSASHFLETVTPPPAENAGHWTASFELLRTGQVNIDTSYDTRLTADRKDDQLVAEQIYYFIKDLFHNHQHHDPKSDSLISICEVDDFSNTSWVDKIHHALFRSIIRYKRYQTENHISKSLGLLAYTEAFERTFKSQHPIKTFQTEQLKDSLRVAQDDARNARNQKFALAESIKSTFFAFFAFLVSMTFMLRFDNQVNVSVDGGILEIATFVMQNFEGSLALVGVLAFIIGFWTNSIDPSQIHVVRETLRLFQGLRLRYYVLVNLTTTFFLLVVGWFLIFGLS